VVREIDARTRWQKLLELRLQTGEPFDLLYTFISTSFSSDTTANRAIPQHHRDALASRCCQSRPLCSEILCNSGKDQFGNERDRVLLPLVAPTP